MTCRWAVPKALLTCHRLAAGLGSFHNGFDAGKPVVSKLAAGREIAYHKLMAVLSESGHRRDEPLTGL